MIKLIMYCLLPLLVRTNDRPTQYILTSTLAQLYKVPRTLGST